MPPGPAGKENAEVRFTYDVSGLLEVEARVKSTGVTSRLVIEGNPGVLSQTEIDARLAALQQLKVHPRDQAENQAVLARAQRLYEERLGEERSIIGTGITDFLQLMERQDPKEIADFREAFVNWLERMDTTFF